MKKLPIIIFLVLIIDLCSHNKLDSIEKMVRFSVGSMCTYDSIGTPQLSVRTYVELSPDNKLKLATGNRYHITERNAPPYSLDKFYEAETDDSLKTLIINSLIDKSYDSLYIEPGDGIWYVLIYKINGKLRQIEYSPNQLPKQLFKLHSYLNRTLNSKNNMPISPFSVDSSLIKYEKQLFTKHAPPPSPAQADTLITFKYVNTCN